MTIFDSLLPGVVAPVVKPSYRHMKQAYHDYLVDSAPCKMPGVPNQCAVRMSVALGRCGFDLSGYHTPSHVHPQRRTCGLTMPHVLGSQPLVSHLRTVWGAPLTYSGRDLVPGAGGLTPAEQKLRNQYGVIFFRNCFVREGSSVKQGDHIDLWLGDKYFNNVIHVPAGGSARAGARLFRLADQVLFFKLP